MLRTFQYKREVDAKGDKASWYVGHYDLDGKRHAESCGPGVLSQYLLQPQEVRFRLRLRPFAAEEDSPVELSKQPVEEP